MGFIHISGQAFSIEQIKNRHFFSVNGYSLQTLEFCAKWLNGDKNFELRTSGSTGTPKQLRLDRTFMKRSADMTVKALGLSRSDTALVCLNTEMIAGKMMLVRGLEHVMNMVILPPSSNPLKELDPSLSIDFASFVPYQIENILNDSPEKKKMLDAMKAILIGGAPISSSLEEQLQTIKAPCYHTFGMTETVSHVALRRLNGRERSDYFKALDNVKLSEDSRHCLIIESPMSDQPVITNDVIEFSGSDQFKWLGRIDHVINSGGIKIHPENLERIIERIFQTMNCPGNFFIGAVPNKELGNIVVLVIESAPWQEATLELLKEELRAKVPKYEVPKKIYFLPEFIQTPSGKIDRIQTMKLLN